MVKMENIPLARALRGAALATVSLALVAPPLPVQAQDTLAEKRLRKLEAEIRALQRKVFPGGDGRFFEPEIAQPASPGGAAGAPSSSAITDLLNRMESLEAQLTRLTSQVEQNSNRIALLEDNSPAADSAASASSAASAAASAEAAPAVASAATSGAEASPAAQANLNAMTGGASVASSPATATPASAPSTDRVRAVSAIVKPQTDDSADDEYSYGFRLWDAKFYPEAQQQLKLFLEKHPSHWRASWGRNLLGRAYLDEGNAAEAAKWFLQNYQADKSAGRAPDSLLYLAVSMKEMGDTKRSCIALAEFSETYAAEAAGRLSGLYNSTRNGLTCSG